MKKVIGIILLVLAVLSIIGGISEGTFLTVRGSGAYAAGYIIGQLLVYGLLIGGGIALLNSNKK